MKICTINRYCWVQPQQIIIWNYEIGCPLPLALWLVLIIRDIIPCRTGSTIDIRRSCHLLWGTQYVGLWIDRKGKGFWRVGLRRRHFISIRFLRIVRWLPFFIDLLSTRSTFLSTCLPVVPCLSVWVNGVLFMLLARVSTSFPRERLEWGG